jgi:hypothetical protein
MRQHEVARAALILGIIDSYDYNSSGTWKVSKLLKARVAAGVVQKKKLSDRRNADAWYRIAVKDIRQ